MNIEQQLEQVEISLDNAKRLVAFGDAIERLEQNKDFQTVILEGYFKEEAARIVGLKADPHMMMPEQQEICDQIITSIGGLRQFFLAKKRMAESAAMAIEADEETHAELLQEQMNDGTVQ